MEPSEILFVEHLGIETSKILNYKCLRSKVFPLIRDEPEILAQAVAAYREALTVRTRESLPQDWATTQNNLGAALEEQGIRTASEAGGEIWFFVD